MTKIFKSQGKDIPSSYCYKFYVLFGHFFFLFSVFLLPNIIFL